MAAFGTGARACAALLLTLSFPFSRAGASTDEAAARAVVEGLVHAPDGSPVRAATVRVRRRVGEVARIAVGADGRFRCVMPAADDYVLVARARGYSPARLGPLRLTPGQAVPLDFTLDAVGGGSEGSSPLDERSTSTGSRYDAGFIEKLPIIGHDYQRVLTLAPGVDDPDGDGNPNVRGSRDTGLQYRLDRGDTTDPATGTFGMNLDPLAIDSVEVVTAGAPAELGRATGGFARVVTRSGGNDFQGSLALYWRGRALDGEGANNQDIASFNQPRVGWHDARAAVRAGGPIVKDRLWYFGTFEKLDVEQPTGESGPGALTTSRGAWYLGKVTWQADAVSRLGLQLAGDPREFDQLGLSALTTPDSGYRLEQGGLAAQVDWTAAVSPTLRLEAAATHFDANFDVTPESPFFRTIDTVTVASRQATGGLAAVYPCSVVNCNPAAGEKSIYQIDGITGRVSGPFFEKNDDQRSRDALRSDLDWRLEGAAGPHALKTGFEVAQERLRRDNVVNPVLFDFTTPFFGSPPGSVAVSGVQVLQTSQRLPEVRDTTGLSTGVYLMDSFKPAPNVVINAGVRLDRETVDAAGFRPFDPRSERRRSIVLWRDVCSEVALQGLYSPSSNCNPLVPYDGGPPSNFLNMLQSFVDRNGDGVNDVPADVAALDLNGDGLVDVNGLEGAELFKHLTTLGGREPLNYELKDAHLSPRIGVSWDPFRDGRTKVFAHWGRYYDRLLPETARVDGEGASIAFVFLPDASHVILPGSFSADSSLPTIAQVDHGLRAPRTDELSIGFERALGSDWRLGAVFIGRKSRDLLQDVDLNHFTCAQAGAVIGIDPMAICGDAGRLNKDRFGTPGFRGTRSFPNGVEDLYAASSRFNQVLRVGNFNSAGYTAYELTAARALSRHWQMQASYTLSRARGQAESTLSTLGDDPSSAPDEAGYLDYDQRHRLKFQSVSWLPHGVVLSSAVAWSTGRPYSVLKTVSSDEDSAGNLLIRYLYPTGRRNDQRNPSIWRLDGRIEKSFGFRRLDVAAFLIAENLLNRDDIVITSVQSDGTGLAYTKDFGRRFELGATLGF